VPLLPHSPTVATLCVVAACVPAAVRRQHAGASDQTRAEASAAPSAVRRGQPGSEGSAGIAPPPRGLASDAHFPAVARDRLTNGLAVLVAERHALPVVRLSLVVRSGSSADGSTPGVAQLTAATLRTGGAGVYSAAQLEDRLRSLGATLTAHVTLDGMWLAMALPSDELASGLALLGAVVQSPRLSAAGFVRAREVEIEKTRQRQQHDPAWSARTVLQRELYALPTQLHPYAAFGATATQLRKVTVADCRQWLRTYVTPANAFLVVAGDVSQRNVPEAADRAFRGWKGGEPPPLVFTDPLPPARRTVHLVDQPLSSESQLLVGWLGPTARGEDSAAMEAATSVLRDRVMGDPAASGTRRERTTAELVPVAHGPALILLGARSPTTETGTALERMLAAVAGMQRAPPSAAELDVAERQRSTELWTRADSASTTATLVGGLSLLGLPDDACDEDRVRWQNLTPAGILESTERYLASERAVVVIVGDAGRVSRALSHFGPVSVLDPAADLTVRSTVAPDPSASLVIDARAPNP
jgi:zinc protease